MWLRCMFLRVAMVGYDAVREYRGTNIHALLCHYSTTDNKS